MSNYESLLHTGFPPLIQEFDKAPPLSETGFQFLYIYDKQDMGNIEDDFIRDILARISTES